MQTDVTSEQLAHVINLARRLKENSKKWDDDVDRSVQFCNKIDELMNQYQLLLNQKERARRQLRITIYLISKDKVTE